MKKIFVLLIIIVSGLTAQSMNGYASSSLFADFKANRVGDGVTIIVLESSEAQNKAATQTGKGSDIGLNTAGTMDGEPMLPSVDFGINTNNSFKGSGQTQASGMVKTKISAVIDSVYSNGNLRITGSRKIVINGEEQIVKIKGVVRSIDIRSDNTVYSYSISDAEIVFEGSGQIDSAQSPGWITKIFHWLF